MIKNTMSCMERNIEAISAAFAVIVSLGLLYGCGHSMAEIIAKFVP